MSDWTIAAIATAPGEGGVAIVRLSGPEALQMADAMFRCAGRRPSERPSHTVVHGHVVDAHGVDLDEALLLIMRAPHTYTGEDVVEFQCHGGSRPAAMILARAVEVGARPAQPGEFTRRAFLNGRLDLTQAEAVLDLVKAQTDRAALAALAQLEGRLGQRIAKIYEKILDAAAMLQASLDFPEEDDVPSDVAGAVREVFMECREECLGLLKSARRGRILRNGLRVVLCGRPNSGKSTLFNVLVGKERAIVSPHPGTTRDSIEEWLNWDGIPVCLVDTAGLRESDCAIEREGVRRAKESGKTADVILYLIEGQSLPNISDADFLSDCDPSATLVLATKGDLGCAPGWEEQIPNFRILKVSAFDSGCDERVVEAVLSLIGRGVAFDTEFAVSERHSWMLNSCVEALGNAILALDTCGEQGPSLAACHAEAAAESVGRIVGRVYDQDLLDSIFSRFCIGK